MVKFLIGGIAGFDTDTFALVSRDDNAQSVPLGAAAGRCLQVLLEAEGEIVTKKTLLAQGWEQYGAVVSDNNLSQSIVRIRKALQQLGADPALLVTVPRIGYRITSVTRVSPHTSHAPNPSTDEVSTSSGSLTEWESTQKSTSSEENFPPESAALEGREVPSSTRSGLRLGKAAAVWLACAALSAGIALWVVPAVHGDLRSNAPEIQWEAYEGAAGQRVFVQPANVNDKAFVDDRLTRLKRTPPTSIDDLSTRLVYLNGSQGNDVASYFLCRKPISQPDADCMSYLLINHLTP